MTIIDVQPADEAPKFARWMKRAVWFCPIGIAVFIVEVLSGEKGLSTLIAAALIVYGGLAAYRPGVTWEVRWGCSSARESWQRIVYATVHRNSMTTTGPESAVRRVHRYPAGARELVVGVTTVVYAALVIVLPFLGDFGVPTVLVAMLWIGGSFVAGAVAPWRLMAIIPIGAAVVFVTAIRADAVPDATFFADPLSILAVPPLVAGEVLALYFGSDMTRARRSGASHDRRRSE